MSGSCQAARYPVRLSTLETEGGKDLGGGREVEEEKEQDHVCVGWGKREVQRARRMKENM